MADKLVIGLTGGIGSGKTAAADYFQKLGVNIIDADIAARKVVEPGQPALDELVKHFGQEILNPPSDGTQEKSAKPNSKSLNRQALRSIVFSNQEQLTWLNNFMHPLIRDWMDSETQHATSAYVIKVIPLLTESALKQQVDRILVIDVPTETQIERVSKRDNSSATEIQQIMQSQSTRENRLSFADDVISNNSSLEALEISVKKMHNKYLKLAATFN
jgi:dephospho-CoA kinase